MSYTPAQIEAALKANPRRWRFRHQVIGPDGVVAGDLAVSEASVRNNDLATQVKRSADYTIKPGEDIDFFTDKVRSWADLLMPDGGWQEWPVGTFTLSKAPSVWDNRTTGPIKATGYDNLLEVHEDCILARHVVGTGANVRDAVVSLLEDMGFDGSQISATDAVLPGAKEWEPGTSKLLIINELLDAAGYDTLTMDPYGRPTSQPYQPPNDAPVVWTYRVDPTSVMHPDIAVELDLFNVPNVWLATISEPDRPVLTAFKVNDDPLSRLSTVNRGRSVVRVLANDAPNPADTVEAVTQEVLQAKVERAATEATQLYEKAEFSTGLMPFHGSGDVSILDYGAGALRYRNHEWDMRLVVGGTMTHKYRRVVIL